MALFFEFTEKRAPNLLDTADIVRDAIYRQWNSRWELGLGPVALYLLALDPPLVGIDTLGASTASPHVCSFGMNALARGF